MQKWAIGLLAILVLFLAALNLRLSDRARFLEERLAAAERRKPAPRPAEPEPRAPEPEAPRAAPSFNLLDAPRLRDEPMAGRNGPPRKTDLVLDAQALTFTLQAPAPEPEPLLAGRRPGFLGIMGEDVPGGGVKINGVVPDSVAVGSGLRQNDVLLEYNGEPIPNLSALTAKIRDSGEGSPVSFRIRRDGSEFYQGVQLGARR